MRKAYLGMTHGSGGRDDHWYWLALDKETGEVVVEHKYSIFHFSRAERTGVDRISIGDLKQNERELFDRAVRILLHGFPPDSDQDSNVDPWEPSRSAT